MIIDKSQWIAYGKYYEVNVKTCFCDRSFYFETSMQCHSFVNDLIESNIIFDLFAYDQLTGEVITEIIS